MRNGCDEEGYYLLFGSVGGGGLGERYALINVMPHLPPPRKGGAEAGICLNENSKSPPTGPQVSANPHSTPAGLHGDLLEI